MPSANTQSNQRMKKTKIAQQHRKQKVQEERIECYREAKDEQVRKETTELMTFKRVGSEVMG